MSIEKNLQNIEKTYKQIYIDKKKIMKFIMKNNVKN